MKSILILLIINLGIWSCSQKMLDEKLTEKVNAEPTVAGSADLQSDARLYIEKSQLTNIQKNQLQTLQFSTNSKLKANNEESLKLRSVLMKDMFSSPYNKSEVKLIQSKIEKLANQRVAIIFDTIDQANGIFGRETKAEEKERHMQWMMMNRDYY
jgi:hypothetical protein